MKKVLPYMLIFTLLLSVTLQAQEDADNPSRTVIPDDLIVQGSECVGLDCANVESFGFTTIRLKENNLRIGFQDTSNSAEFATQDWEIAINDTANGGLNYFAVNNIDTGQNPFRIVGGAPSNSLYVDAQGDVGIGTATPVLELHMVDGDTPTMRLEQDGSAGFGSQSWDVAGNEANFFVRDVTNGSKLPFRIQPNSPESSVMIKVEGVRLSGKVSLGNVGWGSSQAANGTNSTAMGTGTVPGGPNSVAMGTGTSTSTDSSLALGKYNTDATPDTAFAIGNGLDAGNKSDAMTVLFDGTTTIAGDLTINSDARLKSNIISLGSTLAKILSLDGKSYTFKTDESNQKIGLLAQDVQAVFPELVKEGNDAAGILSVNYQGLVPVLINAIKEQEAKIMRLETLVEKLIKE